MEGTGELLGRRLSVEGGVDDWLTPHDTSKSAARFCTQFRTQASGLLANCVIFSTSIPRWLAARSWPYNAEGLLTSRRAGTSVLPVLKRQREALASKKSPKAAPAKKKKAEAKSTEWSESDGDTEVLNADDGVEPEEDADGPESDASLDDDEALGESELVADAGYDDAEVEEVGTDDPITSSVVVDNDRSIARYDPLQAYMREVQRHSLLDKTEEHDLAVNYVQTGDVNAAARLVTANLRLVVKIAYEYRRAFRNMMDLIQEGNIGLMQAVKRYDPYRGVKLSSYAAWWIRAYMLRYMLNNWRLVKLGTTQAQRKLFFNLNKEKARLSAMGIEPSHAEIAKRLNVDEKDVIDMDRRLARGDASLDSPVGDGDNKSVARIDLLPSGALEPEQMTTQAEISQLVKDEISRFRETLSGKDIIIFDERMVADEPLTLQELGDRFGISRERVRQLEVRIAGKLREFLKASLGDAVGVGE
jgi:RNA polymerase sigma-32 factor